MHFFNWQPVVSTLKNFCLLNFETHMPHMNQRWFKHQSDTHGGLLKWRQQIPCVLSLQRLVIRSSLLWSFSCFSWYSIEISTYFNSWSMKYVFVVKIQITLHHIQPWWVKASNSHSVEVCISAHGGSNPACRCL